MVGYMPTPSSAAIRNSFMDFFNEARKTKSLSTDQYWLGAERRLVDGSNEWRWIGSGQPVLWTSWSSQRTSQSKNFVSTYNNNAWRDQDGEETNTLYCAQVKHFV